MIYSTEKRGYIVATIIRNNLKNGISYRIMVRQKQPNSNKAVVRSMTWKKPYDMTDNEAKHYIHKVAYEFEEKIINELNGKGVKDTDISLIDYGLERLERMRNDISPHSYITGVRMHEEMRKFFGKIKLKDVSPALIQEYLDKKQKQGIIIEKALLKKSLKPVLKSKRWKLKNFVKKAKISKETFEKAERGQEISLATAEKICKPLGIKIKDYFDIITTRKPFAKATINSYRKSLCATLSSAKRQRLIAHNYASRDYIETPNGTKRDTVILNEKESIKLAQELEKEENIIIKTSLMACLYMGIRRSELAGLQWQDIDLENNVMKIQRSMHSTKGIGLYYKSTKTESSKREVSMPQALTEQLKEYKVWWDEHRPYFIDPKFKDALFKKDTLMPYNPSIFITWLRKILEQAGLTKVTLHSLRHTNISLQLMAGIDIKTVAGRVGHSQTSTTTDIYSHFLQSSDKKASNIIDKIFE